MDIQVTDAEQEDLRVKRTLTIEVDSEEYQWELITTDTDYEEAFYHYTNGKWIPIDEPSFLATYDFGDLWDKYGEDEE